MKVESEISDLRSDLLHLKALCVVHAGEIEVLRSVLSEFHSDSDAFGADYIARRKAAIYSYLSALEDTNPALAAEIQRILDKTCRQFPL